MKKINKEQIKLKAKEVFLKKGVSHTRVEDITKELGIAKGSFYTHYKSKDELLEEIVGDMVDKRIIESEELLQKCPDFKESLREYLNVGMIMYSTDINDQLLRINLSKNLENLSQKVKLKFYYLEECNKKTLEKILLRKFGNNFNKRELDNIIFLIIGGIKSYRMEKIFYKDMEDLFISHEDEFREKIEKIDIEKDVDMLINIISNFVVGG